MFFPASKVKQKLKLMNHPQARNDSFREFEIEVMNSNGEQQPVNYSGDIPDLSELPSGSYIISFQQGGDVYNERVVK